MHSAALSAIDGKSSRTFAYTFGDTSVLYTILVSRIKGLFTRVRGLNKDFGDFEGDLDIYHLNTHSMASHDATNMKALENQAIADGCLLVFLFDGIGGDHHLKVEKEDHDELVRYIKQKESQLWVSPLAKIAAFIDASKL